MPLTEMAIRSAKPGAQIVKLSDGGGLQLWITPDGAKRWRFAYRLCWQSKGARHRRLSCDRPSRRARSEGTGQAALDRRDRPRPTSPSRRYQQGGSRTPTPSTPSPPSFWKRSGGKRKADRTIVKFEWLMSLARPGHRLAADHRNNGARSIGVLRPIEARGRHETAKRLRGDNRRSFPLCRRHGPRPRRPDGRAKGRSCRPRRQPSRRDHRAQSLWRASSRHREL